MFKKILLILLVPLFAFSKEISVYLENDLFFDDDCDYTHGTQIKYMFNQSYKWFNDVGVAISQTMYTPSNLKEKSIIPSDRPYAGLLGIHFIGKKYHKNYMDDIELTLGIIGKYSGAGATQTYIHKVLDCKKPMGWDHQLANEPIVNLQLKRVLLKRTEIANGLYLNYEPNIQIQAGNWLNDATLGFDLSLGLKDYTDYGIIQRRDNTYKEYWILVGVSGKSVFYSTQLDGNVFRTSEHHVKSKSFVGEVHFGLGFGYKRFKTQILNLIRTDEYHTQRKSTRFSSILVSYLF